MIFFVCYFLFSFPFCFSYTTFWNYSEMLRFFICLYFLVFNHEQNPGQQQTSSSAGSPLQFVPFLISLFLSIKYIYNEMTSRSHSCPLHINLNNYLPIRNRSSHCPIFTYYWLFIFSFFFNPCLYKWMPLILWTALHFLCCTTCSIQFLHPILTACALLPFPAHLTSLST